eukprot:jgi/Psemu1/289705/fgenesh1_pg.394_\
MEFSEEEANPLLTSSGPRRRAPASHVAPMQTLYSSSNTGEDFSKRGDKRPLAHRFCTTCTSYVCARPELDSKGIYYEDTFNDEPWDCTFGTSSQDGVWVNFGDQVGTCMGSMVWILIIYSVLTISLLAHNQKLPNGVAMFYGTICALALACHAKTSFTDPGSIPQEAVPREELFRRGIITHAMCSHCQTYKPPLSHHCRICNRCISRMDHHCPWMNNCVGANNFTGEGEEEPLKLKDIFGIQGYWTWALPIDPVFEDYDLVLGYSVPSRLMREKQREGKNTV